MTDREQPEREETIADLDLPGPEAGLVQGGWSAIVTDNKDPDKARVIESIGQKY